MGDYIFIGDRPGNQASHHRDECVDRLSAGMHGIVRAIQMTARLGIAGAEDNPVNARLIGVLLQKLGYRAEEAGNAVVACVVGIPLRSVTIVPDEKRGFSGHASLRLPESLALNLQCENGKKLITTAENIVSTAYAGGIAQKRVQGRDFRKKCTEGDDQLIEQVLGNISSSDEEALA